MGLKSAIFFGIWIFLFTLYQYQTVNLPDPSYDALTVHRGILVSANLADASRTSRRTRSRCRLWVKLDSNSSSQIGLPCSGDYIEIPSLIGEYAEIRTSDRVMWGYFQEQQVWDVVVAGKHYYDYNFRLSNGPAAKSFTYWSNAFVWVFYFGMVIWYRKISARKSQQKPA